MLLFQFWDTRSAAPILAMNLSERCYCADVVRADCFYSTCIIIVSLMLMQTGLQTVWISSEATLSNLIFYGSL